MYADGAAMAIRRGGTRCRRIIQFENRQGTNKKGQMSCKASGLASIYECHIYSPPSSVVSVLGRGPAGRLILFLWAALRTKASLGRGRIRKLSQSRRRFAVSVQPVPL